MDNFTKTIVGILSALGAIGGSLQLWGGWRYKQVKLELAANNRRIVLLELDSAKCHLEKDIQEREFQDYRRIADDRHALMQRNMNQISDDLRDSQAAVIDLQNRRSA